MLTASEIATKKFDKSIGGYRVEEVDNYLIQVSESYSRLFQEKEDLEHKLEVLAEKLIEYREDEESLRTALLGAQKLGDSVIRESRTKAEIILRDATIKAERLVENAQKQIEHQRIGLVTMQNEVAGFKNRLLNLYKQHLELVSALPGEIAPEESASPEAAEPSISEPLDEGETSPADEMEGSIERLEPTADRSIEPAADFDDDLLPFDALPELQFETAEDTDAGENLDSVFAEEEIRTKESKFGALRFGEGYNLNHDDDGKKRR